MRIEPGSPLWSCSAAPRSNEKFSDGLFVLDLDHAPIACGAWPAFWMYGEDSQHAWPRWGEYDILEAVHNQSFATTTLHTRENCDQTVVNHKLDFDGGPWAKNEKQGPAKNCFVKAPDEWNNQGCGQQQWRPKKISKTSLHKNENNENST